MFPRNAAVAKAVNPLPVPRADVTATPIAARVAVASPSLIKNVSIFAAMAASRAVASASSRTIASTLAPIAAKAVALGAFTKSI